MIISHSRKFIFLKTNKTASTSVEIALSQYCGPEDVITQISPEDEKIRQELGFRGAQNYLENWRNYSAGDWKRLVRKGLRKREHSNHQTVKQLLKRIPTEVFESYFSFSFVRHPYDKIISLYYYQNRDAENHPSLDEFLRGDQPRFARSRGYDVSHLNGECKVNKLYLYEEMSDALKDIAKRIGLNESQVLEMPWTKHKFRTDKRHWSEILTEAHKQKIREILPEECAFYEKLGKLEPASLDNQR